MRKKYVPQKHATNTKQAKEVNVKKTKN